MSPWKFIRRGLRHAWRIHLAVALGVAVGTAVIAGALAVGDSLRGSLRAMTLERLAGVHEAIVAPLPFREALVQDTQIANHVGRVSIEGLLQVPGTLEDPETSRRAAGVQLLASRACNAFFPDPVLYPGPNHIVLTEPLAEELNARPGQELLVRVQRGGQIPAESALGRKTETVNSRRLTVSAIVRAKGRARFSLVPSQQAPKNAFVSLDTLQALIDEPGRLNTILVGEDSFRRIQPARPMPKRVRPTLDDYGLALRHEQGYWQLTSRALLVPQAALDAAAQVFANHERQPVFTYLANRLSIGDRSIPYSTISAIGLPVSKLPQLRQADGQPLAALADDEIALGAWAAEQLGAKVGDELVVEYFEPETTHGAARETKAKFRVAALLAEDTVSTDAHWTPELPGVTDQLTISDWSPPFPFDSSRVKKRDEDYWDRYRAAPKAFVSLAAGRKLWGSRFGDTTSLRLSEAPSPPNPQALADALDPAAMGWQIRDIRAEQLRASAGATPFEGLFLGFSFFLIAAAVMLVALLARLGVERRAAEIGLLLAAGVRRARLRRWLLVEAGLVAALGATLALPLALLYARAMLWGLTTLWRAAVRTESLELYVSPTSLALGWAAGWLVSLAAAWWAVAQVGRFDVRALLAGRVQGDVVGRARRKRRSKLVAAVSALIALAAVVAGFFSRGEAQIGSFFAAGAATMVAALALTGRSATRDLRGLSLRRLAQASAAANPTRGALTAGMVAASVFLIAAIGAFRLDPGAAGPALDSGNGGFALAAQSDQPIYQNLNEPAGREELGFSRDAEAALSGAKIYALRVEPGDDASCLNLYQVARPRIVAVDEAFIERGGWAWAATAAATPDERANPWRLLQEPLPAFSGVATIPVVVDQNTAYYSLHLWSVGQALELIDGRGKPLRLQIVGMLKNSVLQGELIVSQRDFVRHFPDASGYRRFLVECPPERVAAVTSALESTLSDFGFDVQTTASQLAEYFAVQNTYLTTFQTLGALGLLLGTLGLAVVQVRNALERRGELALLRAVGLRRAKTVGLVLCETAALLGRGVLCGLAGAAVALAPQWVARTAGLPWQATLAAVAAVIAAGVASGLIGARAALRAEILPALRGS